MASGLLGKANLSAATNASLFTVTTAKVASFAVSFCNRNATGVKVRLSISTSSTPADDEYLEYEASVDGYGSLERTGLVAEAAKIIVVRSDSANVTATAYGYED